jgi:peptide/nickel transport system ATP-binding protein
MTSPAQALLSADIYVDYKGRPAVLRGAQLQVQAGEIVGLVGESGSGKSTMALAIMRLLPSGNAEIRGSARLEGRELLSLSEREMRDVRGRLVSLIPQSPAAALNPVLRIGTQLREAWV